MITAKEAREKVDTLAKKRIQEEQEIARSRIMDAVNQRKSSCYLDIYISEETKQWLKDLGYKVRHVYGQGRRDDTEVKW